MDQGAFLVHMLQFNWCKPVMGGMTDRFNEVSLA